MNFNLLFFVYIFPVLESRGSEPSRDSDPKLVLTEEIPPPVLAMERLSLQDPEKKENTELLNRILATLLERQITTDECIEISHATPRTSRLESLVLTNSELLTETTLKGVTG